MGILANFRQRLHSIGFHAVRLKFVRKFPCQCRKRRKEKDIKEEDVEKGKGPLSPLHTANSQDADERLSSTFGPAEIQSWQMPKLIVECPQRPGARIHRGTSIIMPDAAGDFISSIVTNLPTLMQIRPTWHLGYSLAVDGVSLRTMYRQVADVGPCILVIEDSSHCIFGAFLPGGLAPGARCYGNHESFVFRYPRTAGSWRTEVYGVLHSMPDPNAVQADAQRGQQPEGDHWVNYFQALRKCQAWSVTTVPSTGAFCDDLGIVVGIDGPALFVDQNLLRGVSWPSAAFGSPCLAAAGPDFVVRNLEVWHWK